MASKNEGANRYYYKDGKVVYSYDAGTPSSDYVFEYFRDPQAFPVASPRMSATVMLVRAAGDGLSRDISAGAVADPGLGRAGSAAEVFMLHRVAGMAFAAGAYVFPGGRLDDSDFEPVEGWAGPDSREWGRILGVDAETARAIVTCAVRETFEECGVLLAADSQGRIGAAGAAWAPQDRKDLESHRTSLSRVLAARGMTLRSDLLNARARWITPVAEPRRYDTFFFSVLVPEGIMPDSATTEADGSRWVDPDAILRQFDRDQVQLLPPTVHQLRQLQKAPSAAAFVREAPQTDPVQSESAIIDGEAVAICPEP